MPPPRPNMSIKQAKTLTALVYSLFYCLMCMCISMRCLSSLCIQVRDYRRRHHPKLEIECAPALVASSRAKFQVILSKNKNFTFLYVIILIHCGTVQGSKLVVEQIFRSCMCIPICKFFTFTKQLVRNTNQLFY